MMETFEPAGSSHIQSVTYDSEAKDMSITFQDGQTYTYHNVPYAIYHGFQVSSSVGSYFHRMIKGRFDHMKHD